LNASSSSTKLKMVAASNTSTLIFLLKLGDGD
jgi:hypothetical protein